MHTLAQDLIEDTSKGKNRKKDSVQEPDDELCSVRSTSSSNDSDVVSCEPDGTVDGRSMQGGGKKNNEKSKPRQPQKPRKQQLQPRQLPPTTTTTPAPNVTSTVTNTMSTNITPAQHLAVIVVTVFSVDQLLAQFQEIAHESIENDSTCCCPHLSFSYFHVKR